MNNAGVLIFIATLVFITGSCKQKNQQFAAAVPSGGETMWIDANGLRLKTKIYKSSKMSDRSVLVLVLHGDLLAPGAPPTYHYAFARRAAEQMDDVVAAALLRPGYGDDDGDRSEGKQGLCTGDNYTPEVVDRVAQAIRTLQTKFHPAATVSDRSFGRRRDHRRSARPLSVGSQRRVDGFLPMRCAGLAQTHGEV